MITVWKYKLKLGVHSQDIQVPTGADVLSVGLDGDDICLWIRVNEELENEFRTIIIAGTGMPIVPNLLYLGTVRSSGGVFVWHVFERIN